MKTIVFFSYKGGVGKSLAVANMAVCLSLLGKNVAILDTDIDAPGLLFKFGDAGRAAAGKGGLVKYLDTYISEPENESGLRFKPFPEDVNPIEPFVAPVQPAKAKVGAVHLIPAGNLQSQDYWRFVEGIIWWKLFSFRSDTGELLPPEAQILNLKLLLNLKHQIQTLTPSPEYLLVDLRNGITEANVFFMQYWADVVACFFPSNEESIASFSFVLDRIKNILRPTGMAELEVVPVLSRTPKDIQENRGLQALHRILQDLRINKEQLFFVHSDRDLEIWEQRRFDFFGTPKNTLLAHEYIALLARLMAVGGNEVEFKNYKNEIIEALKIESSKQEEERVFILQRETGAMINPSDESRNVSFKVSTFNFMVEEIRNGLVQVFHESGQDTGITSSDIEAYFSQALRYSGAQCGARFGSALSSMWNVGITGGEDEFLTEVDRIKKWCDFDSDIGFGRLSFEKEDAEKGAIEGGEIYLRESFLTATGQGGVKPHDRCEFMAGYIEGVLRTILLRRFKVTHYPAGKHNEVSESESCRFEFEKIP